jgi:hypothetical protein
VVTASAIHRSDDSMFMPFVHLNDKSLEYLFSRPTEAREHVSTLYPAIFNRLLRTLFDRRLRWKFLRHANRHQHSLIVDFASDRVLITAPPGKPPNMVVCDRPQISSPQKPCSSDSSPCARGSRLCPVPYGSETPFVHAVHTAFVIGPGSAAERWFAPEWTMATI